jgi:hypothetical protein
MKQNKYTFVYFNFKLYSISLLSIIIIYFSVCC